MSPYPRPRLSACSVMPSDVILIDIQTDSDWETESQRNKTLTILEVVITVRLTETSQFELDQMEVTC